MSEMKTVTVSLIASNDSHLGMVVIPKCRPIGPYSAGSLPDLLDGIIKSFTEISASEDDWLAVRLMVYVSDNSLPVTMVEVCILDGEVVSIGGALADPADVPEPMRLSISACEMIDAMETHELQATSTQTIHDRVTSA